MKPVFDDIYHLNIDGANQIKWYCLIFVVGKRHRIIINGDY